MTDRNFESITGLNVGIGVERKEIRAGCIALRSRGSLAIGTARFDDSLRGERRTKHVRVHCNEGFELLIFPRKNQRLKEDGIEGRCSRTDEDSTDGAREERRARNRAGDCAPELSRKHALRLLPGLTLSGELSIRIN